jgi:hypothetical protein
MKLHGTAARRTLAAVAAVCAAVGGSAIALASPSSHQHAARIARIATPACATSGLDVWLNTAGDGAAGTIYYKLNFTNLSGSTCTLFGFPGVSGVTLGGSQLGSAAGRDGGTPQTVTLANNATAVATLGIVETGNFPPAQCQAVTAAGLKVYPPNQTQARVAPFPFSACSKTGEIYLKIGPVQG